MSQFGGIAVSCAINVVLRKDFEGAETRVLTRLSEEQTSVSVRRHSQTEDPSGRPLANHTLPLSFQTAAPDNGRQKKVSTWKEKSP